MTALPCQLAQAAQFPNQTVCPNNPTGTARPWKAWLRTDYFSGSFEFATRDEAVAYLTAQVAGKPIDVRDAWKPGTDRTQYRATFLQHGLEVFSLADIGLMPLYTVPLPPARKVKPIADTAKVRLVIDGIALQTTAKLMRRGSLSTVLFQAFCDFEAERARDGQMGRNACVGRLARYRDAFLNRDVDIQIDLY